MEDFFRKIAEEHLEKYRNSDSAIAGSNGPYFTKETMIRTTAHWIITFSIMYKITKDIQYKKVVLRFAQSLVNEVDKSKNGAVICISKIDEDGAFSQTNGLIGLAWLIEALVEAYEILCKDTLLNAAEKVYFSQKYDKKLHTWKMITPSGMNLGVDKPFNHGLWFCMSAAKLVNHRQNNLINQQIDDYMKHLDSQFMVYKNGLISHYGLRTGDLKQDVKTRVRKCICEFTGKGLPYKKFNIIEYERAYHLFSLYAFAWLYLFYPEASFFKCKKFARLKAYGLDIENFVSFPEMNKYAYGYNSPAYELPLAEYVFGTGKDEQYAERLLALHQQYNITLDGNSYTENVPDAVTLDARIYEIMQYYKLKELHYGKKG